MPVDEIDAVRADGGLVRIRPVTLSDRDEIDALDERVSDRAIYLRFFTVNRHTARLYLDRLLRPASDKHAALIATVDGVAVAIAGYERLGADQAELALLVDDAHQHEGIGTLLVEHLAAVARREGLHRFIAEVLTANAGMIRLLRGLGLAIEHEVDFNVIRFTLDLDLDETAVAAIDLRDQRSAVASLRPVLAPRSIAVIGASVRAHSVGHEVLANIQAGGFAGELAVVNPHHDEVRGVRSAPTVADLPFVPELAIVAVPAAAVLDVVDQCGIGGVKGVLLLSAGFGETGAAGRAREKAVIRLVRRHGMRMVGPNCLGLINTDPHVRLDATFAPISPVTGSLALVSQSGALGIAVLTAAQRCGIGVAQFVSVGNKADISGNDLMLAWEHDDRVSVIALYLESFGNPRKFARIAQRISRRKPIIAIKAGRSSAGARAGQSHTAAAATSDVVVDALFTEAGVIRVNTMEDMLDAVRVLDQPRLTGPRIAIIGNSGGPEILAADAAASAGLTVVELDEPTRAALAAAAPSAASYQNPVDLGAGVQPDVVTAAVRVLLAAADVDVVLGVFTETLVADPVAIMRGMADAAAASDKLVVATQVGGNASSVAVPNSGGRSIPIFQFPERAAAAIGVALEYGVMAAAPLDPVLPPAGSSAPDTEQLLRSRLDESVSWLDPTDTATVLGRYGIPTVPQQVVADATEAICAAVNLGYPIALKTADAGVHKTDIGGVRLDIRDADELVEACEEISAAVGATGDLLLQSMAPPGLELIVGALQDDQFGPVVMVGFGGTLADVITDRQFRLAPLTRTRAEAMVTSLRARRLLNGFRGSEAVSRAAIVDLLVKLAALAADLPQVAELDLNPVICHGDKLVVVDARIRIAEPSARTDPMARQLRVRA